MIKSILTAAAVAALIAAPSAAQTIRISTVGKSTDQIQADVRAAAHDVCWANFTSMPLPLEAFGACVSAQVRLAQAQVRAGGPYALLSTDAILRQ